MFYFITFLTYLIIGPIATFLHELCHALPILVLTQNKVVVAIGAEKNKKKVITMGRLKLVFNSYTIFSGKISYGNQLTKGQRVLSIISGPTISLIMTLIFLYVGFTLKDQNTIVNAYLNACICIFGIQFLITSLPMTYRFGFYKGFDSDGKRLLNTLKWRKN